MPSRIATGPTGSPESIRDLIRSHPSVIQQGLRLLDFDIRTGPGMSLDAIGVDRSGSLAIVALATGDPETALARLLDGHLWAADQRDLLGRLYSDRGLKSDRPARGFLLAASFTHAFLRRLSLLSVEITPCLARDIDGGDGPRLTIVEPAAPLFGLETGEPRRPTGAERDGRQPFWPEGVLPSEDTLPRGGLPVPADADGPPGPSARAGTPDRNEEMPWPETPEERFPWDVDDPIPGNAPARGGGAESGTDELPPPARTPLPDEPAPPGSFEALTIEELDEFERFERQRHERGRRSS